MENSWVLRSLRYLINVKCKLSRILFDSDLGNKSERVQLITVSSKSVPLPNKICLEISYYGTNQMRLFETSVPKIPNNNYIKFSKLNCKSSRVNSNGLMG